MLDNDSGWGHSEDGDLEGAEVAVIVEECRLADVCLDHAVDVSPLSEPSMICSCTTQTTTPPGIVTR